MASIESVLAVAAGLLATTMAPCLMQVVAFYFFAVSGTTLSEARAGQITPAELRTYKRKLMLLSGAFGLGILVVFTGFGFLVGVLGSEMKNVPLFTGDALLAQRIAGVSFIVLGVWMGHVSRAPVVCKVPFPSLRRDPDEMGLLGMFSMGFVFMFGCASCFAGAIFGVLIVYIGTATAPMQGATVMFFFGLGVVVPIMVSSALLTRVFPLIENVQRWSRRMGLVSSVLMIAFGVLSIFGHFHTLTDYIWYVFYYGG